MCYISGVDLQNRDSGNLLIDQFLLYAVRGKCLRECKAKHLPPKLRNPDPGLLKDFRRRLPYSYLHFAYYKVGLRVGSCCMGYQMLQPY